MWITDEDWTHLQEAAWQDRKSVSELIRQRATGTHHHFEVQGGVASDAERLRQAAATESPKSSESVSPELQACFARTAEMLPKLTKRGLLHEVSETPEYQAWQASHGE